MAHVADHLSIVELEERYRSRTDACSARHFQTIWLLAQGNTIEDVAETTCFVPRWIEELLARYNAVGPQALGDLRRNDGAPPSVLKPEFLAKLRVRLNEPPPDGGLWTSGKVNQPRPRMTSARPFVAACNVANRWNTRTGSSELSTVVAEPSRMRLVRPAMTASTTSGDDTAKSGR
jgi:hypothetical protein